MKKLVAANWKMNPAPAGWDGKDSPYRPTDACQVVVFPNYLDIPACVKEGLTVGAQYGLDRPCGAFTGDINMELLKLYGCTHVLCGHSERRMFHFESNDLVAMQVTAALYLGLIPILCVGETGIERLDGRSQEVVREQIEAVQNWYRDQTTGERKVPALTIAYEPDWAIGTGKNATPDQIAEMHALIRSLRPDARILYGGSVKPENAADLINVPNVDGFLVGGASLDAEAFRRIVEISC